MLSMTDYPTPKFPAISTPEEIKAASEKVMNFWVGALSPMWVPFWAASSFGLSAWAMTQSLSKSEGMLKDIPQMGDLAKWPGFSGTGFGSVWGMAEKTADAVSPVTEAAEAAVKSAPKVAKAMADKAADITTDTTKASVTRAADTVEKATGTFREAIKAAPEPKVAFDPVVEAPVAISEAAVEAPAVLKAAAAKVEPKPIARSVSAVKKPKKS